MANKTTIKNVPAYVTTNGTWHVDRISIVVRGYDRVYN